MNKQALINILLVFTFLFSFPVFSQNTLEGGIGGVINGVKPPYYSWDYLRVLSQGWTREMRTTATAPWQLYDRWFNEKDGAGRFTLLNHQVYSSGTWVDKENRYTYLYILDTAGRVSEMQVTNKYLVGTGSYSVYYEYNAAGNVTRAATGKNGDVYSERLFTYNNDGLCLSDSSFLEIYDTMVPAYRAYYEYDINKLCSKRIAFNNIDNAGNIIGWDTTDVDYYTWQGSLLSQVESHKSRYRRGPIYPSGRTEYSYVNGQIATVTGNRYDTVTQHYVPTGFYRHYYSNNRMTAMVNGRYQDSGIRYDDSVVLNYLSNGSFDTGYQYAALATGWESFPRFRLVFGKLSTGIVQAKPVINAITIYPNPATDYFSVDIDLAENWDFILSITDINGKTIKTINAVNMPAGKNTIKVSALDMKPGVYFINCGNSSVKVVKE